eukprot:TRINITY_DN4585_c0_g1_i2.p1 TRINITY_DN4585_c0_g1~~TRINITY_DN4585_c0_g1_i2.p1  ORF type:complete len:619 (+),score=130.05 TRINITY_DN4585_c0_g1_i2:87-1859(+)
MKADSPGAQATRGRGRPPKGSAATQRTLTELWVELGSSSRDAGAPTPSPAAAAPAGAATAAAEAPAVSAAAAAGAAPAAAATGAAAGVDVSPPSSPALCGPTPPSGDNSPTPGPRKRRRTAPQEDEPLLDKFKWIHTALQTPCYKFCPCGGRWRLAEDGEAPAGCQWRGPVCQMRAELGSVGRVLVCTGGQAWCRGSACTTCIKQAVSQPTLTIIYSPNCFAVAKGTMVFASDEGRAHCCQMTQDMFWKQLRERAGKAGFQVRTRRIESLAQWTQLGRDARAGRLPPGAAAVFHHSSIYMEMKKETVPFWEFYPVLQDIAKRSLLLYPGSPHVDQRHSEKSYLSRLMPPTRLTMLTHDGDSWQVPELSEISEKIAAVQQEARAKGLPDGDVIVKMGCTWGGREVWRFPADPEVVRTAILEKMVPQIPVELRQVYILLQLMVPVVAELRFCLLDGEVVQHGFEGLHELRPGCRARADETGFWKDQRQSLEAIKQAGLIPEGSTIPDLVQAARSKDLPVVLQEIREDFGELPRWVRVDFLITRYGFFLGERESFGADLLGDENGKKQLAIYARIVQSMTAHAARHFGLTNSR